MPKLQPEQQRKRKEQELQQPKRTEQEQLQEPMRKRKVQVLLQEQELLRKELQKQALLLFCRKQPEQQPTGRRARVIFSCLYFQKIDQKRRSKLCDE